jgi:hypothetical protein
VVEGSEACGIEVEAECSVCGLKLLVYEALSYLKEGGGGYEALS